MKKFLHYSRQVTEDICPECFQTKKEARRVLQHLLCNVFHLSLSGNK